MIAVFYSDNSFPPLDNRYSRRSRPRTDLPGIYPYKPEMVASRGDLIVDWEKRKSAWTAMPFFP